MAEIKSAIELAMERTKNLIMDEKEKEQLARKDLEDKLRAIMRRFLEGIVDPAGFMGEYRDIDASRSEKRLLVIDLIIDEFDTSPENERLFDLLELVGRDAGEQPGREARSLKDRFDKELHAKAAGITDNVARRLNTMGISGTSLQPNIREWEEWREAVRDLGGQFRKRLLGWKDMVRATSPKS
jgi:hypothetical protein